MSSFILCTFENQVSVSKHMSATVSFKNFLKEHILFFSDLAFISRVVKVFRFTVERSQEFAEESGDTSPPDVALPSRMEFDSSLGETESFLRSSQIDHRRITHYRTCSHHIPPQEFEAVLGTFP